MRHGLLTRVLHLLVAAAVLVQLADTQFMREPRPGRPITDLEATAFGVHQYVGLAATGVVALFWAWLGLRRFGTSPGRLFPWFSAERRRELWADIVHYADAARRLTLPAPEGDEALASAIHGLGLLIVLVMAVTGTIGWLTWDQATAMQPFTHNVFEFHGLIANLLWAYVILHVGSAVLHELFGHRLLRRMSPHPS